MSCSLVKVIFTVNLSPIFKAWFVTGTSFLPFSSTVSTNSSRLMVKPASLLFTSSIGTKYWRNRPPHTKWLVGLLTVSWRMSEVTSSAFQQRWMKPVPATPPSVVIGVSPKRSVTSLPSANQSLPRISRAWVASRVEAELGHLSKRRFDSSHTRIWSSKASSGAISAKAAMMLAWVATSDSNVK